MNYKSADFHHLNEKMHSIIYMQMIKKLFYLIDKLTWLIFCTGSSFYAKGLYFAHHCMN